MRILIVSDAWHPQVNGVVRTLCSVREHLQAMGHEVSVLAPDAFRSLPCPTYPEIRLALAGTAAVGARIEASAPDSLHIATEGPMGLAARRWCLSRGYAFTTAYHTQFPDYLAKRTKLPADLFWRYIRRFHAPSSAILVSTPTMAALLARQGLRQTRRWGRGVDLARFRPDAGLHPAFAALARPVQLYVGRVAVEKNVGAFLAGCHPGTKVVVGDGPALQSLKRRHPDALFLGTLEGEALARAYASADVFVFPSRTDTFGLVLIEAMACGTPVAAYPVPGPLDLIADGVGAMDADLDIAITRALGCDRAACARHGGGFSWRVSAAQFEAALVPLRSRPAQAASASRSGARGSFAIAATGVAVPATSS